MSNASVLLTVPEMYDADRHTIEGGRLGIDLMENAGRGCFDAIVERYDPCKVVVLCGPGNNGGDGFVVARLLHEAGWPVKVALLGGLDKLGGDAALAAQAWSEVCDLQSLTALSVACLTGAELIVDAIFGAGLSRDIDGVVAQVIDAVSGDDLPVVAIDMPSGVDGNDGSIRGHCFYAELTVTFFRPKVGHMLLPGRLACGEVVTCDIGISEKILEHIKAKIFANGPNLWGAHFPQLRIGAHKYDRGHALIMSGGPWATGAARLAARGALRVGSGLVTVASPREALPINAAHLTAIMLTACDTLSDLEQVLTDRRKNAIGLGPGCGVGEGTKAFVSLALKSGCGVVIDADGLTSWAKDPDQLFDVTHENAVLTPHEGEFGRLFPDLKADGSSPITCVREAAVRAGCVVLLKGPDTLIAAPNGRVAISNNGPRWLATAGSGDVLTGIITGLLAQGMPAFEAACAGAWIHGEAGAAIGPGLIAEDLPEELPGILGRLLMILAFEGSIQNDAAGA